MGHGERTTAQAGTCGGIPGGTLQRRAGAKASLAKRWQTKATRLGQELGPSQREVSKTDDSHQRATRDPAQRRNCVLSLSHWQLAHKQRLPHMRWQARMDAASQNHTDADWQSARMAHPKSRGGDQQEQCQASTKHSEQEESNHQRCRWGHCDGRRLGSLCYVERDRSQSRTRTPTGCPHPSSQQPGSHPIAHKADWASKRPDVCLQTAGAAAGHGRKDGATGHCGCPESPRGSDRARKEDSATTDQNSKRPNASNKKPNRNSRLSKLRSPRLLPPHKRRIRRISRRHQQTSSRPSSRRASMPQSTTKLPLSRTRHWHKCRHRSTS